VELTPIFGASRSSIRISKL
jgi:hypothetical protein